MSEPMARVLPPLPAPPDRPTWWLLDDLTGWRAAPGGGLQRSASGALALPPAPGSGRRLDEASGSLGGLAVPATAALDRRGNLYLLDRESATLLVFDPCDCLFRRLPCIAGAGNGPLQLDGPSAIAICCDNLLVCDTGNRRVQMFALKGLVLRDTWAPPPAASASPWWPAAIACDGRGRVFVADPANGCVHRFASTGLWLGCGRGLGSLRHLALDADDRLYAVADGEPEARVLGPQGEVLGSVPGPEAIAERFGALPFAVDAEGRLHLGCGVFDPSGRRLEPPPRPAGTLYRRDGLYITQALDSGLYRCQWHRVLIGARVPEGSRVRVHTFSAETEHDPAHIAGLGVDAWQTGQVMRPAGNPDWDCLVRSGPGRYLWLRLELAGNGAVTPLLHQVRVEFPRIGLRRYLPAVYGQDPQAADFTDRFLSLFDTTLRGIERTLDHQAAWFDPVAAPADADEGSDFLAWLGTWVGIALERQWPEARRRVLLREAPRLFSLRGTPEGLRRRLLLLLGWESLADPPPLVLEHFRLRRWLHLGAARLGEQAVLWGQGIVKRSQLDGRARLGASRLDRVRDPLRDPFHVHAHRFTVFVPACYRRSDRHRKGLENLLAADSPAHTRYHIEYVEPRFRVGVQATIGLDAVIGRWPAAVELAAAGEEGPRLGRATILSARDERRPGLRIGRTTRIGARLD